MTCPLIYRYIIAMTDQFKTQHSGAGPGKRLGVVVARLTSASLIGMCTFVLIDIFGGQSWAKQGAIGALLVFAVFGLEYFRFRERVLLTLAVLVTVAAFTLRPDAAPLVGDALGTAAFLAAFMILLAMLREGASTSKSVLNVGRYLTQQPPGRRYVSTHIGGHFLGVIFNFGALSLLGPLLQRGIKATSGNNSMISAIREQRQISALDRGFSSFIIWAPTAITQATIPTVIANVDTLRMATMGAAIALSLLAVGWAEDRFRWRHARAQLMAQGALPEVQESIFPTRDFLLFSGVCVSLAGLAIVAIVLSGVKMVPAMMLAAPLVTVGWIAVQNGRHQISTTIIQLRSIAGSSIPGSSPEAITLACAGYLGLVSAQLVPIETLSAALNFGAIPPLVLYALVIATVPLVSNLGLPPIFTVTFLGGILNATPGLQVDPTLLGLSLVLGWTLNLTSSPFSASSLILARTTGIPGRTLSWRWNGAYSLAAYATFIMALAIFSGF